MTKNFPSRRAFLKSTAMGAVALSSLEMNALANESLTSVTGSSANVDPKLKIVTFKVDVTPPPGEPLAYDINEKTDAPIYISGIILDDGVTRIAWVSCDYIYICGESYVIWSKAIAKAAGTTRTNVFLHAVHQHDSIRLAPEYNPKDGEKGPLVVSDEYCEKSLSAVTGAIKKATNGPWQRVVKLLTGETRVGGLAANRRLTDENGKFVHTRFSGKNPPNLQAWPTGKIDPILRTICFEGENGRKIAALHFYATHPMAAYRRKMVGPDVPGWALRYVEKQAGPEMLNVYFTGCGGDITFGKYNITGDAASIELLGKRLGDGILQNLQNLEEKPFGPLEVKRVTFNVPFNPDLKPASAYEGEHAQERRYLMETIDLWRQSTLARLSIGPKIHFLSFELGEVFVDYQLYAQSLIPEHFLATASYGNGVYWYIPTAAAFAEEGGYETSDRACIVTPEIDGILRKSIRDAFSEVIHAQNIF